MTAEHKRLDEKRAKTADWRRGGRTSASGSGAPCARTTAPAATPGTTSPTTRRARAPTAGARTASPGSATTSSGCASPLALWNGARPDPQGAALRPDQRRGQPRRGRQGVLLLPRQHADALLHDGCSTSTRSASSRTSDLVATNRRARPRRVRVRAARHRRLRRRPLLRRVRRVRQGGAGGHAAADHRAQPRARRRPTLHLLPTLWFRNTWSWATPDDAGRRCARCRRARRVRGRGDARRARRPLAATPRRRAELLFTENETNTERLFGSAERVAVRQGRHRPLRRPRRAAARSTRRGPAPRWPSHVPL